MSEMITLENLSKRFGDFLAVDAINLSVARGEVLGFLGPNGAGKSTTMKMVAGFLPPTGGRANICGYDVVQNSVAVKKRIGYLPEGAPAYGDMSPRGFLNFIAEIRGFDGRERGKRVGEIAEKVILDEVLDQPIDTLSKGFKRRVGLAQAMLHDPEVLILDEPTDGLDPNQKHHVRALIQDMAKDKAIVISTHILEEVEAVCSRAVIIARGKLLVDGSAEELIARAPNHNTVVISVVSDAVSDAAAAAGSLAWVRKVEVIDESGGTSKLRVFARDGASNLVPLGEAMKAANINIMQIYVERGTLDDVFRNITTFSIPEALAHA